MSLAGALPVDRVVERVVQVEVEKVKEVPVVKEVVREVPVVKEVVREVARERTVYGGGGGDRVAGGPAEKERKKMESRKSSRCR